METLKLVFTQFNDESLTISGLFLLITFFLIIIFWMYNRKKFHELSHQIPASVVKNYLDSIIQNSNSLKSSLFRGGGLDLAEGVPSVLPIGSLRGGESVSGSGVSNEEYSMKMAEIASLRSQVGEKSKLVTELEKKLKEAQDMLAKGGDGATAQLTAKVKELEGALAKAGSGDPDAKKKLDEMKSERDKLKEKLQEYEVIEDDIANLKRLQKENEDLKKALEGLSKGGAAPAPAAAAPAPKPAPAPAPEPVVAAAPASAPVSVPKGPVVDPLNVQLEGSDKSAEDLLSEFEKMLG